MNVRPTRQPGPIRLRLARALLVITAPSLFLLAAEGVLWLARVTPLVNDPLYEGRVFMRDCRSNPKVIERVCAPGEEASKRSIHVIGGSSVQGYPPGKTVPFPTHMQSELDGLRPGRYQVRNLGVACRDSIYVRKCARRAGGRRGDLYVIYAGHNDFANFMIANPYWRIWSEEYPWLFAFEPLLGRTRLYSALTYAVERRPRPGEFPTRLPDEQFRRSKRIALKQFTDNLTRLIERAGEKDLPVVLVTVVGNLHEFPIRRQDWETLLNYRGPYPPEHRDWHRHYTRGVQLYRAGDLKRALEAFAAARDHRLLGRAPSTLNARIRQLVRRYRHVYLVDFEQELHRVGVEEGIGCNFFGGEEWCDQFHPNTRTQKMIARAVIERVLEM